MPFSSAKQRDVFFAAKNNPALRKKLGLSLAVIKQFLNKDKKRHRFGDPEHLED